MNIECKQGKGAPYALVTGEGKLIRDAQSALDLMVDVQQETGCDRIALYQESLTDAFFKLASGIAGDVLQKMVNYQFKLAVIGDFSGYKSKPLQDLIRECNRGNDVFFVETEAAAAQRLGNA